MPDIESDISISRVSMKFSSSFPKTTNWCQSTIDKIKIKGKSKYVVIHHGVIEVKKVD